MLQVAPAVVGSVVVGYCCCVCSSCTASHKPMKHYTAPAHHSHVQSRTTHRQALACYIQVCQWPAAVEEAEKQEGGGQRAGGVAHAHVAGVAHARIGARACACVHVSSRCARAAGPAHAHDAADAVPRRHRYRTALAQHSSNAPFVDIAPVLPLCCVAPADGGGWRGMLTVKGAAVLFFGRGATAMPGAKHNTGSQPCDIPTRYLRSRPMP